MNILNESFVIISVMGSHAGESSEQIFSRKISDIQRTGKTFWFIQSYKSNPPKVQLLFQKAKSEGKNVFCIFISPSSKGGARPTTKDNKAESFSSDKIHWEKISPELSPVTGKISTNSFTLVFDVINLIEQDLKLDLWNYADFEDQKNPVLPKLGVSTICAVRKDMSQHPNKIKSNMRKIEAVARVSPLGCVWVR
jgi:hypothetical protein